MTEILQQSLNDNAAFLNNLGFPQHAMTHMYKEQYKQNQASQNQPQQGGTSPPETNLNTLSADQISALNVIEKCEKNLACTYDQLYKLISMVMNSKHSAYEVANSEDFEKNLNFFIDLYGHQIIEFYKCSFETDKKLMCDNTHKKFIKHLDEVSNLLEKHETAIVKLLNKYNDVLNFVYNKCDPNNTHIIKSKIKNIVDKIADIFKKMNLSTETVAQLKKDERREEYNILLVVLLIIILCLFFYFVLYK